MCLKSSALTLLVGWEEGYPVHKRRAPRATYPERFFSGTSGGRQPRRTGEVVFACKTAVKMEVVDGMAVISVCMCALSADSCWFLANVNSHPRSLYAVARPSVVFNVCAPYSGGSNLWQYLYGIRYFAIHWHPLKISRRSFQGNPSAGELNMRGSQV